MPHHLLEDHAGRAATICLSKSRQLCRDDIFGSGTAAEYTQGATMTLGGAHELAYLSRIRWGEPMHERRGSAGGQGVESVVGIISGAFNGAVLVHEEQEPRGVRTDDLG